MSSFNYILEKVVWGSSNFICNNPVFYENMHEYELGIHNYLFKDLIYSSRSCGYQSTKFKKMTEVLNNPFISEKDKNKFLEYLGKAEKTYLSFNKLAFLYKWKIAKIGCNSDMYMNELKETDKNTITILHTSRKYIFTIPDLNKICIKSLDNPFEFYSNPLSIKNPYNNLPLLKSHLYYFYFLIKKSDYNVPEIFYQYFKCNFNLRHMIDTYDSIMRDGNIKQYATNVNDDSMEYMDEMIEEYNRHHLKDKIDIDNKFPKDVLYKALKNSLKYYYKSAYSLCNSSKYDNRMFYMAYLYEFKKKNPLFGRRKYIKTLFGKQLVFNTQFTNIECPINYDKDANSSHIEPQRCYSKYVNSYIENKLYINEYDECDHSYYGAADIPLIRPIGVTTQLLQRTHLRFNEDNDSSSDNDMERDTDSVS